MLGPVCATAGPLSRQEFNLCFYIFALVLGSLARDLLLTGDHGRANDPPLNRKTEKEDGTDPTPPSQGPTAPPILILWDKLLTLGLYERHSLKSLQRERQSILGVPKLCLRLFISRVQGLGKNSLPGLGRWLGSCLRLTHEDLCLPSSLLKDSQGVAHL